MLCIEYGGPATYGCLDVMPNAGGAWTGMGETHGLA